MNITLSCIAHDTFIALKDKLFSNIEMIKMEYKEIFPLTCLRLMYSLFIDK